MYRPENIKEYNEIDLKLGIKSSLPHPKSTIALVILLWECCGHPAELKYSKSNGQKGIIVSEDVEKCILKYLENICEEDGIDKNDIIKHINENQIFKSQIESLIVAFELVWKIAKFNFCDNNKTFSSERTGGFRYTKKITYSANIDIIHSVIINDESEYLKVLLNWIGISIDINHKYESILKDLLTVMSEFAIFKMQNIDEDIIFNQNSIYEKIIEKQEDVDINGDAEAKGSLRILKSLLSEDMNSYLTYNNKIVNFKEDKKDEIVEYQKRVDTLLGLHATKIINFDYENVDVDNNGEDVDNNSEDVDIDNLEENRISGGVNILLYGVPGSGKSWTIQNEYCKENTNVERLVFYPDYSYSDFVGQILPNVSEDGQVSYKFMPGPFTTILHDAYKNPNEEYVLIIEEINRGNAPAIFGEIFQLFDRKKQILEKNDDGYPIGTSEYGITNANIAKIVYGDINHKVRIPSNLSIIGTMNTSDQNVFTLDTAFQRRWDMRLIENSFENVDTSFANAKILDTGITWKNFCIAINNIILENNTRMTSTEDKRLGVYFINLRDLQYDDYEEDEEYENLIKKENNHDLNELEKSHLYSIRVAIRQNRKFPEKILKYLWDDAFKFSRDSIFETSKYKSLESLIHKFVTSKKLERFDVFKENVRNTFISQNNTL